MLRLRINEKGHLGRETFSSFFQHVEFEVFMTLSKEAMQEVVKI